MPWRGRLPGRRPRLTLAPAGHGSLVTSQRGTVQAVDLATSSLVLRTDDGHLVLLGGEDIAADRLALRVRHYCPPVPGFDGEPRPPLCRRWWARLAYVAMSRARDETHAWVVADDTEQAAEDLRRDWSTSRTPTWAIDAGLPAFASLTKEAAAALTDRDRASLIALVRAQAQLTAERVVQPSRPSTAGPI